ncbi:MAG: helix-turn-helix domain-containing protein [Firmicutes bacterium]|jgi:transcriptional regulator with XRE-family HTH domain|nr:helix-turn-helix domain-containing protein [Bacillota bacterium]
MKRLFKDIFRQLLHDNSTNAYKVSKDTGISEALISYWKNGKQLPKYDSLNLLCDYFNVSADYLLGRTDEQTGTYYANNVNGINFSNLIQGSSAVTVNSNNNDYKGLSNEETEILDIYRSLNIRNKTKFLNLILDMEKEENN